jgi:hypothetical protein
VFLLSCFEPLWPPSLARDVIRVSVHSRGSLEYSISFCANWLVIWMDIQRSLCCAHKAKYVVFARLRGLALGASAEGAQADVRDSEL